MTTRKWIGIQDVFDQLEQEETDRGVRAVRNASAEHAAASKAGETESGLGGPTGPGRAPGSGRGDVGMPSREPESGRRARS